MPDDSRNNLNRPDPDALLGLANRAGRGKLTIFLGAAPGVGKTFAMLSRGPPPPKKKRKKQKE